jgi:hypothetical protein
MSQLIYSALKTPDGTILQSRFRHDYVSYQDKNGKNYFLDGGTSYIRSSMNGDEEFISHYADEPHEIIRELPLWGSRGKDGKSELKFLKPSEMEDSHLDALLDYVSQGGYMYKIFENEILYRDSQKSTLLSSEV